MQQEGKKVKWMLRAASDGLHRAAAGGWTADTVQRWGGGQSRACCCLGVGELAQGPKT